MDECKKSLREIKTCANVKLCFDTLYNPNKQIYVASDVRNLGLGVVILHKEDGKLKPIQHVAKTQLPAEIELFADRKGRFSYHICDQEIS